jgi:hypothetical protein
MVMEIVTTWKSSALVEPQPVKKVEKKANPPKKYQKINFYPPVPSRLPNLREGYLFNQARYLEDPKKKKVAKDEADQPKNPEIDFDALQYNGSIIIGDMAKGLIIYPEPKKPAATKKRVNRRSNSRKKKRGQKAKIIKKTVEVGDVIGSFHITHILADKIIFERGDKKIEKMLFDSDKKRIVIRKKRKKSKRSKKRTISKRKRVTKSTRKSVRKPKVVQSRRITR